MNKFREKLALGEPLVGTHVSTTDSSLVELMGIIGFDYIWIDMEHSCLDKKEVLNHIIAAQGSGAAALVRIPWNDPVLAKPILEMGPDAIVFPFIRSVREAEMAIASCFYPPKGIRGYGPSRASYLRRERSYLESYEEELFRILQIEHIDAVNCLEGIVKLEGLDALVVGPMDLSASVGKLGLLHDPEIVGIFEHIGNVANAAGVPLGFSYDYEPELLDKVIQMGVKFASVRSEGGFILNDGRHTLSETKKLFGLRP